MGDPADGTPEVELDDPSIDRVFLGLVLGFGAALLAATALLATGEIFASFEVSVLEALFRSR